MVDTETAVKINATTVSVCLYIIGIPKSPTDMKFPENAKKSEKPE